MPWAFTLSHGSSSQAWCYLGRWGHQLRSLHCSFSSILLFWYLRSASSIPRPQHFLEQVESLVWLLRVLLFIWRRLAFWKPRIALSSYQSYPLDGSIINVPKTWRADRCSFQQLSAFWVVSFVIPSLVLWQCFPSQLFASPTARRTSRLVFINPLLRCPRQSNPSTSSLLTSDHHVIIIRHNQKNNGWNDKDYFSVGLSSWYINITVI